MTTEIWTYAILLIPALTLIAMGLDLIDFSNPFS